MDPKCPGRIANQAVESTLMKCPGCGRMVEIFADEERIFCRCGHSVFRQAKPTCFQWCKNAPLCMGIVAQPSKPPSQYQQALAQAFADLKGQTEDNLIALGASRNGQGLWHIQVLDGIFVLDLSCRIITLWGTGSGKIPPAEPSMEWRILLVHYLAATPPRNSVARWLTFADLPDARSHESTYRARVLGRLCNSAGRDRVTFTNACLRIGAERIAGKNEEFQFLVFPRLPVRIIWHAGDEETGANVSMVYPDHIASLLSVDDLVVLSEKLVGRLDGAGW